MGLTVVGNPAATVITSSPGFNCLSPSSGDVSAVNAKRFADEPEFVSKQLFDFHLSETSPCNSVGDFNITQTQSILFLDLEGNLRDNVPDLGALKRIN
jgi:hypothetical protein